MELNQQQPPSDIYQPKKLMRPTLVVLLVILAIAVIALLYVYLIYVPYMRDNTDDFDYRPQYEELDLEGDGTGGNPYLIYTVGDLAELAEKVNDGSSYRDYYFVLMNNLDMYEYLEGSTEGWSMIGTYENPFSGVFDGMGHTISGVRIYRPDETSVGLFGQLSGAEIYRLNVEAQSIRGKTNAGALAGMQRGGVISHCTTSVTDFATDDPEYANCIGGLVGLMRSGVIEKSSATVSGELYISQATNFGGLVGYSIGVTITGSHVELDIEINGSRGVLFAGGFIGNVSDSKIERSYASGIIIAERISAFIGGFVCEINSTDIDNCYTDCDIVSNGNVSLFQTTGNYESNITFCYSASQITYPDGYMLNDDYKSNGYVTPADNYGSVSFEDMRRRETYVGWNFNTVWYMPEDGGFPKLR